MLKTISKIGNSQGLIFDSAIRDLTGLQAGDPVNVTVHDGGAITIVPLKPTILADEARQAARGLIRDNDELFKRLA